MTGASSCVSEAVSRGIPPAWIMIIPNNIIRGFVITPASNWILGVSTDAKGDEQTLEDVIDDSTFELAIHHANITTYRRSLTKAELKLAKERAGLRLKNGGLGIHSLM